MVRVLNHLGRSYQAVVDLGGDSEHGGRVHAESLFQYFRASSLVLVVAAIGVVNTLLVVDGDAGGGGGLRAHLSTDEVFFALFGYSKTLVHLRVHKVFSHTKQECDCYF